MDKYTVKARKEESKEGCWSTQVIDVLRNGEKVGDFKRDYHSYGESTFAPFFQNGSWYALCSLHYEALSVMKLPECTILGEEKRSFCPVDVYIPTFQWDITKGETGEELKKYPKENHKWISRDRKEKEYTPECWKEGEDILYEKFAFVSGCQWGDDCSMKVEIRDISKAHEGIIKTIPGWDYYELPELPLKECVRLSAFQQFMDEEDPQESINATITLTKTIRIKKKKEVDYSLEFFD